MRSGRLFWAVILIGLGFLFLANNLGFITVNVWGLFWPVFLVLLGIWFLLGSTAKTAVPPLEEDSVELGEAESASITVKYGGGRLTLNGSAQLGQLVSGRFANGLDAHLEREGNHLKAVLQPRHRSFGDVIFPGSWISGRGLVWDFGLSKEIPLALVFEIGAAEVDLDLSELQVRDLVIKTGASSTAIKLPDGAGATSVTVEAGAASLDITVPEGVAARISADSGLSSVIVDQNRFPKQAGVYQSPGYDSAGNKADIRIESGVAKVEIH